MTLEPRAVAAATGDSRLAVTEYDDARRWFAAALREPEHEPLAAEVWVLDPGLTRVLLVRHRWRGWVPPGGSVEPGETPRDGAARELFEEVGVRPELRVEPAAVAIRRYHPDWALSLGLSYAAILDEATPLVPEEGQPVRWWRLDEGWESYFPDDAERIRRYATWLAARR